MTDNEFTEEFGRVFKDYVSLLTKENPGKYDWYSLYRNLAELRASKHLAVNVHLIRAWANPYRPRAPHQMLRYGAIAALKELAYP
jgi:hypothetical protein